MAGTSLAAKFTVQGTLAITFTGKTPPIGASLDFLVNAGNVTCDQPSPAKADLAYIQTDQIDTPRTVTDATQKVVWQWDDADPFGANMPNEDPDGDGNRFTLNLRFAGQYFDRETGLHYNYYRDYDPASGRYIESDPIGLAGGMNTYVYVEGQPSSRADPFGLQAQPSPRPQPSPTPRFPTGAPANDPLFRTPGATLLPRFLLNPIVAGIVLCAVPGNAGQSGASCSDDPGRTRKECRDDDYCQRRWQQEQDRCWEQYGEGGHNWIVSACLDRARERFIACSRGAPEPPEWSDADVNGWQPPKPPRRGKR